MMQKTPFVESKKRVFEKLFQPYQPNTETVVDFIQNGKPLFIRIPIPVFKQSHSLYSEIINKALENPQAYDLNDIPGDFCDSLLRRYHSYVHLIEMRHLVDAADDKVVLDSVMDNIAEQFPPIDAIEEKDENNNFKTGLLKAPIKSIHRILEKLIYEYNGDFNQLCDLARGSLVYPILFSVYQAAEKIDFHPDINLYRLNDRFKNPLETGYRDLHFSIQLSTLRIVELQFHLPEIINVKQCGQLLSRKEIENYEFAESDLIIISRIIGINSSLYDFCSKLILGTLDVYVIEHQLYELIRCIPQPNNEESIKILNHSLSKDRSEALRLRSKFIGVIKKIYTVAWKKYEQRIHPLLIDIGDSNDLSN